MKVLLVLENLAERCGANVNIAIVLTKKLAKNIEVHALARYDDTKQISFERSKVFSKVHTFYADQSGKLATFTSGAWSKAGNFRKVMHFCKAPNMLISMIDAKYYDFSITKRKCKKAIEDVCKEENYDAVIGVSAPYYIMQAVAEANITFAKMALQLDPFTNNYTLSSQFKNRRKRVEYKTLGKLNKVFAGDYLYDELVSLAPKQGYNIIKTPLPGIILDDIKCVSPISEGSGELVHFIFVGQFYKTIRNPRYLLELFTYLPQNYVLHIVGGGCDDELEKYETLLGSRLVRHGWVSKEEANAYIEQYDVLVNVNNTIDNQLPSKIFEYIGTGKPILNICKSRNCLSIPYIQKYINGVSLVEEIETLSRNADMVEKFIKTNRRNILSKEDILCRFGDNTDAYVAELILSSIL